MNKTESDSTDLINLNENNQISVNKAIYKNEYLKIEKIGKGSFGKLLKVKKINSLNNIDSSDNNEFYAIKLIHENSNVVSRQYDILSSISHPNVIKVFEKFNYNENECIVYEYFQKDLLQIINNKKITLEEKIIKVIIKQILEGLDFLHSTGIIHRDIKPENILLNQKGKIVICDFDLARNITNKEELISKPLSRGVATLYYRPPEVFYGSTNYDFSLDMWAVGCLLSEMVLKEPIFKGKSEFDVMFKIYEVLSSANENNWPGCSELPNYFSFGDDEPKRSIYDLLSGKCSNNLTDLISNLIVLNPNKRLTAKEALNHPFFLQHDDSTYNQCEENVFDNLFI